MTKINIWYRRISQTIFFGLWAFLFWKSAHQAVSPVPPDLFLETDPLAAVVAMAAARIWVPAVLYGLILIGLTVIFGRFFCGWVCPLGTILDVVGRLWRGKNPAVLPNDHNWRRVKYYLLIAVCVGAFCGSQLVFFGDPLVLLFRATATGIVPSAAGQAAFLSLAIILVIIGLCGVTHRFWCRYLCPLGALYAVFSRFSIFRRRRVKGCDVCKGLEQPSCQHGCPMGASPIKKLGSPEECIRSMNCRNTCHADAISYAPTKPLPDFKREAVMDLDRRTFLFSAATGAVVGMTAQHARSGTNAPWSIVRPPMVTDEVAFKALCLRCGQCMRSCPTGTLQPLFLEAGLLGLWTPAITPLIQGCKDNCNACSKACPTGAIPAFGPKRQEKWTIKMGQADFESGQCISYGDDTRKPCLKCVEVCPNRAIIVDRKAKPERPTAVDYSRCVGCGLCVSVCRKMTIGRPAMSLTSNGVGFPTALVVDARPQLPSPAGTQNIQNKDSK
jgi:ferredoxin